MVGLSALVNIRNRPMNSKQVKDSAWPLLQDEDMSVVSPLKEPGESGDVAYLKEASAIEKVELWRRSSVEQHDNEQQVNYLYNR